MHPDTLGGYERGDTFPDQDFLARYKRDFSVNLNWLLTGEGDMFELLPRPKVAADFQPRQQRLGRLTRLDPEDIRRLERAVSIVEEGLETAGRVARPEVKAGMISAAFEMLEEPSETTVGRILRLVKG